MLHLTSLIKSVAANVIMRAFGLLPLKNVCVFSAFEGKSFGDNPKAIFDEMNRRGLSLRYVWLMRDRRCEIPGAITVRPNTIRGIYYLSTARLWIDCTRKSKWVVKRPDQYYVQTWHGDVCLKHIERDASRALTKEYIHAAIHDSEMVDLMLSGSKFRTENYRTSFWYNGEILELGTPKTDSLFVDRSKVRCKIRKEMGIPTESKIALYVPTFRDIDGPNAYISDYHSLLISLSVKNDEKWVILRKLHPNMHLSYGDCSFESEYCIDVSYYSNTNELIAAADLVITDYSSCMFDALEVNIPAILYMADMREYATLRGFYFELEELPFPITYTSQELFDAISEFDFPSYSSRAEAFCNRLGFLNDGHSSTRVVDEILKRINYNCL